MWRVGDEIIALPVAAAGFEEIELAPVYWDQAVVAEAVDQLELGEALGDEGLARAAQAVFSAKVTARKPLG